MHLAVRSNPFSTSHQLIGYVSVILQRNVEKKKKRMVPPESEKTARKIYLGIYFLFTVEDHKIHHNDF